MTVRQNVKKGTFLPVIEQCSTLLIYYPSYHAPGKTAEDEIELLAT